MAAGPISRSETDGISLIQISSDCRDVFDGLKPNKGSGRVGRGLLSEVHDSLAGAVLQLEQIHDFK
jgi:hypothetical protein